MSATTWLECGGRASAYDLEEVCGLQKAAVEESVALELT